ncbi:MAG: DUF885 domain-containing protein [Gemmatimonadaceae bacterium]|nr:DUF885 domain-containing protein [Gemmatimonadaceae bacterium]
MRALPVIGVAVAAAVLFAPTKSEAQTKRESFPSLAHDFVYTTLTFSPSGATQSGLHTFRDPRTGRTLNVDQMLDDFSLASIERQRTYYSAFRKRLERLGRRNLDAQTRADYDLLQNAVDFANFNLDEEKFYEWRPQMYAENLGGALFSNMSLEYAAKNVRARDLTARVEKVPAFIAVAKANLKASNDIYRRVAAESVDGDIDLIKGLGAEFVKGTPSEARYTSQKSAAVAALQDYKRFITDELPRREQRDWRFGKDRFAKKWRYYLQVSASPEEMLDNAEDSLVVTRERMLSLAEPLHKAWFPSHSHSTANHVEYLNAVVSEVMKQIGTEHVNRDSLMTQAERDVSMLERYIVDHRILSLRDFSNLKVIETPKFMRGIYGVAGAVFAPALQPNLSTFYWVTPVAKETSEERAESKLREYNRYKMLTITIHEAMPGHAVQGEYANRVLPDWRRLLRAVYGNTPYIEGWAVYTEHMMLDAGVNGGDQTKAELTEMKGMLRIYMNSIIDIRLQTMGMTDEEAVRRMMTDAFQERGEAEPKLQRAQLDYVQLNAYLAGVQEWTALRRDAETKEGTRFNACRYHDTVLLYGPIPVPEVRRLYMSGVKPTAKAPTSRCEGTSPN